MYEAECQPVPPASSLVGFSPLPVVTGDMCESIINIVPVFNRNWSICGIVAVCGCQRRCQCCSDTTDRLLAVLLVVMSHCKYSLSCDSIGTYTHTGEVPPPCGVLM